MPLDGFKFQSPTAELESSSHFSKPSCVGQEQCSQVGGGTTETPQGTCPEARDGAGWEQRRRPCPAVQSPCSVIMNTLK